MEVQLNLFESAESLLSAAADQADKAEAPFKESTKLYFIARYFVAVYESRYGEIPIQVWNEYRNALDHFFRWQTSEKDGDVEVHTHDHLHKMEKHLQRAVLDILKIFIHRTLDSIDEWKGRFTSEVYNLVDNGDFHLKLTKDEKEARKLFEVAKISDHNLGQTGKDDHDILQLYLNATFEADKIKLMLIDRQSDFERAKDRLSSIHGKAHNLSKWEHYKIHIIFYLLWTAILVIFGSKIKEFFKSFFTIFS